MTGCARSSQLQVPDEAAVETDLRQQGCRRDAEARPGARHRHAGAGARRAAVAEYAPNAVKKAVIGVGHGDKKQIHMMVKVLMPKAIFDTDDAADALAIAICHAHHRQSTARPAWPR